MATLIHPATCDTCKYIHLCKYREIIYFDFGNYANKVNKKYDVKIQSVTIKFKCRDYKQKD